MTKHDLKDVIINVLLKMQSEGLVDKDTTINLETRLFGRNGILPSIHLITAIIDIENEVFEKTDKRISLTDAKMFSVKNSPFISVEKLVEFTFNTINN